MFAIHVPACLLVGFGSLEDLVAVIVDAFTEAQKYRLRTSAFNARKTLEGHDGLQRPIEYRQAYQRCRVVQFLLVQLLQPNGCMISGRG